MTEGEKHVGEMPGFVRTAGFSIRVGLSILIVFGWLAFLILWLFFYADKYGVFQNIAILLVSIIVGIGMLAALWVSWGLRFAGQFKHREWKMEKPTLEAAVSMVAGVGWLIFLIIWLYFYASNYNGYQNLAIFIVSILVWGAISSIAWLFRWMRAWRRRT